MANTTCDRVEQPAPDGGRISKQPGAVSRLETSSSSHGLSRRRLLVLGGGLLFAHALPGCDGLAESPVAIAAHSWPGYELIFLARREGWLDEKRVRLLETGSSSVSLQALAEGRADGAALTLDEVLRAREKGLPLSVVMVFDVSAGADLLLARPEIRELSGLIGRTIAVELGAVGELMLTRALQAAGLARQDVKLVHLPVDRHPEAWLRREIDASICYEPVASRLLAQGAVKLFDSGKIPDTIVDVLAMRSDVLDRRHAGAVRHLIAGHFRALAHLGRNPHDAAYRMAHRMNLPASEVLPAFRGLVLPDVAGNHRLLGGKDPGLLARARELSAVMVEHGLLREPARLDALVRAEFLPAVGS